MDLTELLRKDLTRLHNLGVKLVDAMQVEQFHDQMEAHFHKTLQKDFQSFKQALPRFEQAYQSWFSEARIVIARFLPGRLADFVELYQTSKPRKEIRKDNYTIEDYLRGVEITAGFDKKVVAGPADAIPLMQQQLNILDSVPGILESRLAEAHTIVQAQAGDKLLAAARELLKNQLGRSAGAVCAVILEQHLEDIRQRANLKATRKNMSINDYNELFHKASIYDFPIYRQIQFLAEMRDLCVKNKKAMPTTEQVGDMITVTERVLKTVFF